MINYQKFKLNKLKKLRKGVDNEDEPAEGDVVIVVEVVIVILAGIRTIRGKVPLDAVQQSAVATIDSTS